MLFLEPSLRLFLGDRTMIVTVQNSLHCNRKCLVEYKIERNVKEVDGNYKSMKGRQNRNLR